MAVVVGDAMKQRLVAAVVIRGAAYGRFRQPVSFVAASKEASFSMATKVQNQVHIGVVLNE
jgi:phage-related protein